MNVLGSFLFLLAAFCAGYCLFPVRIAFFKFTYYGRDWAYKFPNIPIFREFVEHEKFRYLYLNRIFFSGYEEKYRWAKMGLRFSLLYLNSILAIILLPLSLCSCVSLVFFQADQWFYQQWWLQAYSWCWMFYLLGHAIYAAAVYRYRQLEEVGEHAVYQKCRHRKAHPELLDFP